VTARRTAATLLASAAIAAAPLALAPPGAAAASPCPQGAAHRGLAYRGGATENSLLGFQQSWAVPGMNWIETDLWFTTDHVGVLMHDDTVDRTTNGTGRVIEKTAAQFAVLQLDDGQHPPTFTQLLAQLRQDPKRHAYVELKRYLTPAEQSVLLGQVRGMEAQVYVTGFYWEQASMQRLKAADPALNVSLNVDAPALPMPASMQGENFTQASQITAAAATAIHAEGGVIRTGGDTTTAWSAARDAGADVIVTSHAYAYQQWRWDGCPTPKAAA